MTRQPMNTIITEGLARRLDGVTPAQFGDLCGLFEAAWHHMVPDSLNDTMPMTSKEARQLSMLATEAMSR